MIGGLGNADVVSSTPASTARGLVVRVAGAAGSVSSDEVAHTTVASSVASQTLLAANPARKCFSIFNLGTEDTLYIRLGDAPAATNDFAVRILPGGYYESPINYTGAVQGVWDGAVGAFAFMAEYT